MKATLRKAEGTDMSDMVERVAKAVHDSVVRVPAISWEICHPNYREIKRCEARVAISAMRPPSINMCIAGLLVYEPNAPEDEFATGRMFEAMIDAALKDSLEP